MNVLQKLSSALTLLLPLVASAGALYGTVRSGGTPLVGSRIELACPSFAGRQTGTEVTSDGSGSFSLRVAANGRCEMRVQRGNLTGPAFDVYLSNNPLRFDFVVDQNLVRAP
jgi:hypothetical protein